MMHYTPKRRFAPSGKRLEDPQRGSGGPCLFSPGLEDLGQGDCPVRAQTSRRWAKTARQAPTGKTQPEERGSCSASRSRSASDGEARRFPGLVVNRMARAGSAPLGAAGRIGLPTVGCQLRGSVASRG